MATTLEEIRQRGLEALRRELGRAGPVRFLQQFETGRGNHARERHEWVDRTSLKQLRDKIGVTTVKKKTRSKRSG